MTFPGGGGGGRGGGGGAGGRGGGAGGGATIAELDSCSMQARAYGANPNRQMDWNLEPFVPMVQKKQAFFVQAGDRTGDPRRDRVGRKAGHQHRHSDVSPASAVATCRAAQGEERARHSEQRADDAAGEDTFHAANYQAAGELAKAGVTFAFSSGGYENVRLVPFQAAMSVAWGLEPRRGHQGAHDQRGEDLRRRQGDRQPRGRQAREPRRRQRRPARDPLAHPARGHRRPRRAAREQAHGTVQALHGQAVTMRRIGESGNGESANSKSTACCSRPSCEAFLPLLALGTCLALGPTTAATPAGPLYAIKGAKIFTAAGAPIDNGTIVMRNGVIEDVGANVTVPADAVVIDAAGHERVPGPDRHGQRRADRHGRGRGCRDGAGRTRRRRRRRRRGGGAQTFATLEEAERAKRAQILRPDFVAADHLRTSTRRAAPARECRRHDRAGDSVERTSSRDRARS